MLIPARANGRAIRHSVVINILPATGINGGIVRHSAVINILRAAEINRRGICRTINILAAAGVDISEIRYAPGRNPLSTPITN